ncbi:MAG: YdeI/OmpD-associated family protein [Chloroflexota bacterium]
MQITSTLYITDREEWRKWLAEHHATEPDVWLVYYRKESGKPRLAYNDAVDEALCFGWIDSTYKDIDEEKFAQRFSPRNPRSPFSPMNKERARRLIEQGRMMQAGLDKLGDSLHDTSGAFEVPPDIVAALQADPQTWENFQSFPESYKRIRVGWIDGARHRPEEFEKRLRYFLKMTAKNKRFGMVQ